MSGKKPMVQISELDPRDNSRKPKIRFDASTSSPESTERLKTLLRKGSISGQIETNQSLAKRLPDEFAVERENALHWLKAATSTTNKETKRANLLEARCVLLEAVITLMGKELKDARSKGGEKGAITKRSVNESRNRKICELARDFQADGEKESYINHYLSERYNLSARHIARIRKTGDM